MTLARHLIEQYYLLFATLLVQVAIMAMVASLLLRFRRFTQLVLSDPPDRRVRVEFGIVVGVVAAIGAWTRLNLGYAGTDFTVVGPLLAGVSMGWDAGLWAGVLGGLVPLRHGEWLAPVMGALIGAGAGLTRSLSRHPETVRDFSPVPFGNLGTIWRRWRRERALDHRLLMIAVGTLAEVFRTEVARFTDERWLFSFQPRDPVAYYAVVLACLTCIGVSVKIWNTPRIEAHLRRQEALLAEARLDALRSQINPHFLFNTLNTINALVRTHPEQARTVIVKLSALLRRMLYSHENTCTLREELDFVESYLAIEAMRFGEERLRVIRDVEPAALAAEVPCVILQPLVENAIKHGIGPKASGGVITIAAHLRHGMLEVAVRDTGVGMSAEAVKQSLRRGIGLTNIRERLHSLYGAACRLAVDSEEGVGTTVRIALPHREPASRASEDTPAYTSTDHT